MAEEVKNKLSEEELRGFLKNLRSLQLSRSEENDFQRQLGVIKKPSKDNRDVTYVKFNDRLKKKAVLDSFEEGKKEDKGSENQQKSKKNGGKRHSERSMTKCAKGREIHNALDKYLKETGNDPKEPKKSENKNPQISQNPEPEVIEEIQNRFQCKIVASEVKIQGFATNEEKKHYWKGKIDAVALDTNGRVLIIEWKTCDNVTEFWRLSEYGEKLHQCLVYRELVDAHLKEYFDKKPVMIIDSGIMIVALDRENINVFKPRLCVNFESLKAEDFFKIVYGFTWQGKVPPNLFSQEGSKQGRRKKIDNANDGSEEDDSNDCEEDLKKMSTDGEWGTERELKVLAHALNIPGFDGETTGQEHYYSLEPVKQQKQLENLGCNEDYLSQMSKDGVWGTENELKPLPYALDEQIAVAAADESWYDQIFKPMRQQKELETFRPGFDGKEHFYSLETVVPRSTEKQLRRPCLCGGAKKCAHRSGRGQCSCKAAGFYCSDKCSCSPSVCINRSAEMGNKPCTCEGKKKCAHQSGRGQCSCKAAGFYCSYKCSCSSSVCINRA